MVLTLTLILDQRSKFRNGKLSNKTWKPLICPKMTLNSASDLDSDLKKMDSSLSKTLVTMYSAFIFV